MHKVIVEIATRDNLLAIVKEVARIMNGVRTQLIEPYEIRFSNKNLSEIIGKIMEKVASDVFTEKLGYEVRRATSDREPDLFLTVPGIPLEIKMTSTSNAWTGGEFSKRPFDYLLCSWGGDFNEFFVCCAKLKKSDWKSNMSKNFYGPSLSLKKLMEIRGNKILVGNVDTKGKMVREKVN